MPKPEGQPDHAIPLDRIEAYDFSLPVELIAQRPLAQRDASRLLVLDRATQTWSHKTFRDLPEYFTAGDIAVFNQTRVLPAKLQGLREATGGKWSGLFLGVDETGQWRLIGHTRGKLQPGESLILNGFDGTSQYRLHLTTRTSDGWLARPETEEPAEIVLSRVGTMPLPPYIERDSPEAADGDRYQTVYASEPGAVAAPTAGLHFTPEILQQLEIRGVLRAHVTLHVGVGTFRPVSVDRLDDHIMHEEWASIEAATVDQIESARGRTLAVGTTAVRTLETAAAGGQIAPYQGQTDLFIRPPYQFKAVDCLLTNFHLPKSTLLVLVSTFAGRDFVLDAYAAAVAERYRFFSYGDAMLIL